MKKSAAMLATSRDVGLKVNRDKEYVYVSSPVCRTYRNVKIVKNPLKKWVKFKCLSQ
jgi:hypothetical protein